MIAMALGVSDSHNLSRVVHTALQRAEGSGCVCRTWGRESEGVLNYEFIITFCAGMIIVGLFVDFSLSRGREGISSRRRHSRMN